MAEQWPALVEGLAATGTPPVPGHNSLPLTAQLGYVPVIGQAIMRVVPDSMVEQGLSTAFAPGYELPDFALPDFRAMTYSAYDQAGAGNSDFIRRARRSPSGCRASRSPSSTSRARRTSSWRPEPAVEGWKSIDGAQVEVLPEIGHSRAGRGPAEDGRADRRVRRRGAEELAAGGRRGYSSPTLTFPFMPSSLWIRHQ